ncbi:hypothetical protein [Sphingopyxis fribergensis]
MIGVEYASGNAGYALEDFNACTEQGSAADQAKLDNLFFNHINERLRRKTPAKLEAFLRGLRVWQEHGNIPVYKTSDLPCCAYTTLQYGDELVLLILGFCVTYPGSAGDWWEQVIQPRLVEYL